MAEWRLVVVDDMLKGLKGLVQEYERLKAAEARAKRQIEIAHRALDELEIPAGDLVMRIRLAVMRRKQEEAAEDGASIPIDELDVSIRTWGVLKRAGITMLGELCAMSESDALKLKDSGRKTVSELREILFEHGLSFRPRDTAPEME